MSNRLFYIFVVLLLGISSACVSPIPEKFIQTTGSEIVTIRTNEVFNISDYTGKLQVRYFNLEADKKSGDAILIISPDGKTMLIDSGKIETGRALDHYLDQLGIDRIDYAIATHPHHDHIGGYQTILRTKTVANLFMPNLPHTTEAYASFLKIVEEKKIEPNYIKSGDSFFLGDDVKVEVLSPSEEALDQARKEKRLSTTDINNLSLVMKLTYQDNTFLFTGDIYKKQEKRLVHLQKDLAADVLDAPHHGDDTSSHQKFIQAVQPKYTLISANILQSQKVYQRYIESGSEVFATSIHGNILLVSDGTNIEIIPELDYQKTLKQKG
ncbi:ComEC/Rec2 family competence protein [Halalkalibacter akibai]|uniref:S-layer protein n=1 Tax=Halalkalibacter akibai (strain ATCC 43226 / DSM 21942 / CIP 109018 / JCM 9157 / 1139) TaxID=1236973 RepID=W4R133_HALA3|nr:MBL fold metallo-hydrolase [Halalkalibacter akibai]GAE37264.1 S-layer protein [Halalkalibacter akibai JCM 9157]